MQRGALSAGQRSVPLYHGNAAFYVRGWQIAERAMWPNVL
jgi:hypothetical protein